MLTPAVRICTERGAAPGSIKASVLARKTAQARIVRSMVAGRGYYSSNSPEARSEVSWEGDIHVKTIEEERGVS
tara:strand:- start:412 stop:633 length:222 start_codon:yes stop_codon:yes gene_type:complete